MPCVHLTKPVLKKKANHFAQAQPLAAETVVKIRASRSTTPAVGRVRGAVKRRIGPLARASRQASKRQTVRAVAQIQTTVAAAQEAPISTAQVKSLATKPTRADLINAESRLGSRIFGPVPAGHHREFFHDRQNIWIWHEDWSDQTGHARQLTIRYEVRPSGVFKKIAAGKYFKLEGAELENFRHATRAYLRIIKQHLYHQA